MENTYKIDYTNLYAINKKSVRCFDSNIILVNVNDNSVLVNNIFPIRMPFFCFFIVQQGRLEVELDYTRYYAKESDFLIILPEHLIQNIWFSDNLKGQLLIVDQNYFSSIEKDNFRLHQPVFLNVRKYPKLTLQKKEYDTFVFCLNRLGQKIIQENHHLKEALIKNLFLELMLEVDNVLIDKEYNSNFQKLTRQEELTSRFFQLLQENGKTEHKVLFYADKLHVTTQYLAFVLKQLTGKTTYDWIAETLIIESKILLKHSQQTIQEISDTLNFCDPSAFGKFFKTHIGVTPFQYRRNRE